ncbi:MAG: UDP-N-acetylmuramate dehydrogenase [Alphaproteobacteria bacterium]
MAARQRDGHLIGRLPPVRGRYTADAPLAPTTWFRVGGPAEVLFRPADADDLASFLANRPKDVPVTVLGVASNTLVRDGGVPGVVIRLARGFNRTEAADDVLTAGAAVLCPNAALAAADAELAGLEFMTGVPGTVGGAVRMNAGAFGGEIRDVLLWAEAIDGAGRLHRADAAAMGLSYRHSAAPADWIFVRAAFRGRRDDVTAIRARMAAIQTEREASQPQRARTGGSTFKNPPGARAWELIDRAGCRGLSLGAAAVSEKHCNFLINTGEATAAEIEGLGETVRRRVLDATGVALEWEIRRIGLPAGERP